MVLANPDHILCSQSMVNAGASSAWKRQDQLAHAHASYNNTFTHTHTHIHTHTNTHTLNGNNVLLCKQHAEPCAIQSHPDPILTAASTWQKTPVCCASCCTCYAEVQSIRAPLDGS